MQYKCQLYKVKRHQLINERLRARCTLTVHLLTGVFLLCIIIPAKARDYGITGVGLSVCLSVCYHDN